MFDGFLDTFMILTKVFVYIYNDNIVFDLLYRAGRLKKQKNDIFSIKFLIIYAGLCYNINSFG